MSAEYLFIRILEACNANCFMCDFALSKDRYRFGLSDLLAFLPRVVSEGVKYVRMTGGEPLMHGEIVEIVKALTDHGVKSSIITNGALLERKASALVDAGLSQIIVSLDGLQPTHDRIRATRGLFDRAVAGIRAVEPRGVLCRVNTVCGPSNFREMPDLQSQITDLGVKQWELSSLKLEKKLDYTPRDIADAEGVIERVYVDGKREGKLVPMGKIWCGDTAAERARYFDTGVTPRADGLCHVVQHVRYVDAKNAMVFPCSLLPHRPEAAEVGVRLPLLSDLSTADATLVAQAAHFARIGPERCTGCSTTAAGFSNALSTGSGLEDWSY